MTIKRQHGVSGPDAIVRYGELLQSCLQVGRGTVTATQLDHIEFAYFLPSLFFDGFVQQILPQPQVTQYKLALKLGDFVADDVM